MLNYNQEGLVNIGTGKDLSIKDLASMIREVVGFEGDLVFNKNKPNGTHRKLMDVSKLSSFGWNYKIELRDGIEAVYEEVKAMNFTE